MFIGGLVDNMKHFFKRGVGWLRELIIMKRKILNNKRSHKHDSQLNSLFCYCLIVSSFISLFRHDLYLEILNWLIRFKLKVLCYKIPIKLMSLSLESSRTLLVDDSSGAIYRNSDFIFGYIWLRSKSISCLV